jgi:hypothetical protein
MIAAFILSPINTVTEIPMYCFRCRSYLFTINREVLAISMGTAYPVSEIPRNMGWLKHKCHSCKFEYNMYFN